MKEQNGRRSVFFLTLIFLIQVWKNNTKESYTAVKGLEIINRNWTIKFEYAKFVYV